MTPGAGTAQSVGRVGRRWMRASSVGLQFCCGRFAALRRSSGRHKWRPYVCERLTVVLRWPFCGVALVIRRHKWRPYVCERLTVVWRRLVRGIASVIRASQVAPLRLRAVDCCFASVVRASQMAPCVFCVRRPCGFFEPSGKGGLHSGGFPKILCFQIVVPHVCITFAA